MLEDRAGRDVQFLADNLAKFMAAARKRPEIGAISHHVSAERAAEVRGGRPGKGAEARCGKSAMFTRPFRLSWAGCSSTTSTNSAVPGRCMWKRKLLTASNVENVGQFYVRNNRGGMVPLSALTKFESRYRPRIHHALQRVPVGADQRQRRARL